MHIHAFLVPQSQLKKRPGWWEEERSHCCRAHTRIYMYIQILLFVPVAVIFQNARTERACFRRFHRRSFFFFKLYFQAPLTLSLIPPTFSVVEQKRYYLDTLFLPRDVLRSLLCRCACVWGRKLTFFFFFFKTPKNCSNFYDFSSLL